MKNGDLSIYIHIPFCKRKCYYCDFCSFSTLSDDLKERYVLRICEELGRAADRARGRVVGTVYFGGGTPSLLDSSLIGRMLGSIRENFDLDSFAEITLECNPATAEKDFFEEIRALGVNRLSIGLQSANDAELELLGRLHDYSDFERTYLAARSAGFSNVSVDVMYGVPKQNEESFKKTLERICELKPEHISSYLLKIEEGTAFWGKEATLMLPDEDAQLGMYRIMTDVLTENGYVKYEVSNFSKPGFESAHNVGYWTGREYLGFGVAAHSFFGGERSGNSRNIEAFIEGKDITEERETVGEDDAAFEFVMLGMRMGEGISLSEYESRFKRNFDCDFPSARRFEEYSLVKREGGRLRFTDEGFFLSNTVLSEFLSDFAKAVDISKELL